MDIAAATSYYLIAADEEAQYQLAKIISGPGASTEDVNEAITLMIKLHNRVWRSQLILGIYFNDGSIIPADKRRAETYLLMAAAQRYKMRNSD